jgi:hypothetical protein
MENNMPAKGVGVLINDVARLLRRLIDQRAHTIGLTSAQWRVLAAVARAELKNEEPLNQAGLAEQMDMEPITLSRLVDRMEGAASSSGAPTPPTGGRTGFICSTRRGRWSPRSAP